MHVIHKQDKTIFEEEGLLDALDEGESAEVDMGYKGLGEFRNPQIGQTAHAWSQKNKARARGENVNGNFKKFEVLNGVFWHDPKTKHQMCFESVAVICQLRHDFGGYQKSVEYDVTYY